MVVGEVDGRLVIDEDADGAADKLTWDTLNDVDYPKDDLDDVR